MTLPDLTPRLIVGMSGASGAVYGVRILEQLRETPIETHLVVSKAARRTLAEETNLEVGDLEALADVVHPNQNIGATIASGSFRTMGMIVAPCSIKSMSEIASGMTSTLLARAADVVLKERRKLVLMVRETPLHRNHLRTMADLSELGAIIAPPVPAFYTKPASLDDLVDHTVGRALDLFEIETGLITRWCGTSKRPVQPHR
ncbi:MULTISPECIES: UbiX family flavin prenyltransferase [Rhodococcus]|jgi:4-hydroxy-3-polyprenylbenzoate decarboxylase|uniref:UbiX family flavin prenyltransferase n=1 Tax=Rhodococcus opacus TaxID=37919 RepID=UPI001FF42CBA|nr:MULTISPECIES: UbiX family flavin prenyltransferase [Rhodococcus]MDH6286319.1 4-hydroxy-3-polyprenylbenzoate decarboxylase [Rhodococcus opacus]UOT03630.1 UbiX family flavin prenyltransferase [Rhodococcus opacus]GLK40657.1 flavin prenyltransferase UbiX [Rhodococcus wratislaviensis]